MKKVDVSELQGPLKDFFEQLSGKNGRSRFNEFKLWLKKVEVKSILSFLRTAHIDAQPTITTSKKHFKEMGVRWMNSTFRDQFLGLEVEATKETELAVRKLEKASLDVSILAELGEKAEISVSQFVAFLAENRKSSKWFLFYLRDRDGNLWAVLAHWSSVGGGWGVSASSVGDPRGWRAGRRVVSLN